MRTLGRDSRWELVGLLTVLALRDHAKVPRNMQPADGAALQGVNVIHFVWDACFFRQARGFYIERLDSGIVRPRRSGLKFCRDVLHRSCRYGGRISTLVSPILVIQLFSALFSVGFLARKFLISIQAIVLSTLRVYVVSTRRVVSTLFGDVLVSLGVVVGSTYRKSPFYVPRPPSRRTYGALTFHVASIWASMMRLTSSAMEMPSRLASRFRYARCGSVNEIICLVMSVAKVHFDIANQKLLRLVAADRDLVDVNADGARIQASSFLKAFGLFRECREDVDLKYRYFLWDVGHSSMIPRGIQCG